MSDARHDEIAARAYRIWEAEGRPEHRATEHWLRAEREIAAEEARRNARAGEVPSAPPAPVRETAAPEGVVAATKRKPRGRSKPAERHH